MLKKTEGFIQANDRLRTLAQDNSQQASRSRYGLDCEISVLEILAQKANNLVCYHSFRHGPDRGPESFEIDLLILTSSGTVVPVEVKAYKGRYALSQDKKHFVRADGEAQNVIVKSPISQIERNVRLLKRFLLPFERTVPISPAVVFVNEFYPSEDILNQFESAMPAITVCPAYALPRDLLPALTMNRFAVNTPAFQLVDFLSKEHNYVPALVP